jgi:Flp pilus assembly protein TadG
VQSLRFGRGSERGQSLAEFALVAPLFFLLIFGVIQMGIIFGGQIALGNGAREVARYASTVRANSSAAAITQANALLQRSIPAFNSGASTVTVTYCYYADPATPVTYSQKVIVTIRYGHTLFIPLVGAVIDTIDGVSDNRFTTTVREEMRVETPPFKSVPLSTPTLCGANP